MRARLTTDMTCGIVAVLATAVLTTDRPATAAPASSGVVCTSFADDPAGGSYPAVFVRNGILFESLGGSFLATDPGLSTGESALLFSDLGVRIRFPFVVPAVRVTAATLGTDVVIEAFAGDRTAQDDALLSELSTTIAVEPVEVVLAGSVAAVELAGGDYLGSLVDVCAGECLPGGVSVAGDDFAGATVVDAADVSDLIAEFCAAS
jgi:hypothetical protein